MVKRVGSKEERIVNHILHTIVKDIDTYTKQFNKPIIVMENLRELEKT